MSFTNVYWEWEGRGAKLLMEKNLQDRHRETMGHCSELESEIVFFGSFKRYFFQKFYTRDPEYRTECQNFW